MSLTVVDDSKLPPVTINPLFSCAPAPAQLLQLTFCSPRTAGCQLKDCF